jgi:S-DNA-T family DNA segregation ATPase FtsK/SpoIIIE
MPANFVGRVGAFLSELSFQLFGYAAYLIPAVIGVVAWHYFWCQKPDAAYTKVTGAALLFGCTSAFLSLIFGSTEIADKPFNAGGSIGGWLAAVLSDFLNRTGSIIVLLTWMYLTCLFLLLGGKLNALVRREHERARAKQDQSAPQTA